MNLVYDRNSLQVSLLFKFIASARKKKKNFFQIINK